jgi:hypothetical protein
MCPPLQNQAAEVLQEEQAHIPREVIPDRIIRPLDLLPDHREIQALLVLPDLQVLQVLRVGLHDLQAEGPGEQEDNLKKIIL